LLCALAPLALQLGREEVVAQALQAARDLDNLNHRVECLAKLISVLSSEWAEEIVEQARIDALQIDSALHSAPR
jgi:hypothetical protein